MRKIIILLFNWLLPILSLLTPYFQKITSVPMVNDGAYASGCAWGDYDNDGKLDLIVTAYNDYGSSGYPQLYKNLGNGNFQAVTNNVIVTNHFEQTLACIWGDYNHDCKLDLFVATGLISPTCCIRISEAEISKG